MGEKKRIAGQSTNDARKAHLEAIACRVRMRKLSTPLKRYDDLYLVIGKEKKAWGMGQVIPTIQVCSSFTSF